MHKFSECVEKLKKKFTNIVAGAPNVSSPSLGRFFPQFGEDLFGFATYGFLWVALSYLFHLSIRVVVELGDEVLICTYIKLDLTINQLEY